MIIFALLSADPLKKLKFNDKWPFFTQITSSLQTTKFNRFRFRFDKQD